MALEINIPREPQSRQTLTLDGVAVTLELRWNERGGFWVLDLYDASDTAIVVGIVIRVGRVPLSLYTHLAIPTGVLVVIDTAGGDLDPTFDDFGGRVKLIYLEASEV